MPRGVYPRPNRTWAGVLEQIRSGNTMSCGCLRREVTRERMTTHGATLHGEHHPLFSTWRGMRRRCSSPGAARWDRYGGRGIRVCKKWERSFWTFAHYMESLPGYDRREEEDLTMDRIDGNGNYEPGNVRWATRRKQSLNRADGFSLAELLVVVCILGILMAVALPTLLGARTRAQDRAAQAAARNTYAAAKVIYTDNSDYNNATTTALETTEPSLDYVVANSTSPLEASIAADATGQEFGVAVLSDTDTCWYMHDTTTGIRYGQGTPGTCAGTDALGAVGASW